MPRFHIRDDQGNPLCGQSQAYLRRSVIEFAGLSAHAQCNKCLRLMDGTMKLRLARVEGEAILSAIGFALAGETDWLSDQQVAAMERARDKLGRAVDALAREGRAR